jgi:hypothetical protein
MSTMVKAEVVVAEVDVNPSSQTALTRVRVGVFVTEAGADASCRRPEKSHENAPFIKHPNFSCTKLIWLETNIQTNEESCIPFISCPSSRNEAS